MSTQAGSQVPVLTLRLYKGELAGYHLDPGSLDANTASNILTAVRAQFEEATMGSLESNTAAKTWEQIGKFATAIESLVQSDNPNFSRVRTQWCEETEGEVQPVVRAQKVRSMARNPLEITCSATTDGRTHTFHASCDAPSTLIGSLTEGEMKCRDAFKWKLDEDIAAHGAGGGFGLAESNSINVVMGSVIWKVLGTKKHVTDFSQEGVLRTDASDHPVYENCPVKFELEKDYLRSV